jgi:hypothetical protein
VEVSKHKRLSAGVARERNRVLRPTLCGKNRLKRLAATDARAMLKKATPDLNTYDGFKDWAKQTREIREELSWIA